MLVPQLIACFGEIFLFFDRLAEIMPETVPDDLPIFMFDPGIFTEPPDEITQVLRIAR